MSKLQLQIKQKVLSSQPGKTPGLPQVRSDAPEG